MTTQFSLEWSYRFGLAWAPLFEAGEIANPNQHAVLLDGGSGSFILSEGDASSNPRLAASWAWSAGLPHHVEISGEKVLVTHWATPNTNEQFTLKSVSERLEAFYNYLNHRRAPGRRDVVATLLDLFRAVRGEVQSASADDETSVSEFLGILADLVSAEKTSAGNPTSFAEIWKDVGANVQTVSALGADQRQRLEVGFKHQVSSLLDLDLSAVLAVRHAASAIFQEAHFAFQSASQIDLFGHQPSNTLKSITRGAHHFTPPSLARSIVEQALAAIPQVAQRAEFVVCDPACGSGAFLTEAARTLRRLGFNGKLRLVGRDLSPSAISMARFALHAAKFDWQPSGGMEIELNVGDALEADALPVSDLVVMNPPFLAWPMMDKQQKGQVAQVLGATARHRPDLSMAFVTRALNAVGKGGVVASLLPSSVLALNSGKLWRNELLERGRLAFLGSFGEYGLFVHALVQVAAIILVAGDANSDGLALRSANESAATGEALRALRRLGGPLIAEAAGKGWRIAKIDKADLLRTDRWRILPASVEDALNKLDELGMPRVEDLFDVKQGLLTGLNDAFILSKEQLNALPKSEQKFFRPALFRNAISDGAMHNLYFVFFPYNKTGLIFPDEDDLKKRVPEYFAEYLLPRESELRARSGVDDNRVRWWSLSRYYPWVQRTDPRILTKYFGSVGDFVVDESASWVPLQGYAWFLHKRRKAANPETKFSPEHTLRAYYCLLNSRTFARLLKVFSDPVQGGQFNLSARFVRLIPLPDLLKLDRIELANELVQLASASDLLSPQWLKKCDDLSRKAWGENLVEALAEMDDA